MYILLFKTLCMTEKQRDEVNESINFYIKRKS
jgi:hypothetical protein